MEKIIKKTRFEIIRDERKCEFTEIMVKDTDYQRYFFVCDDCSVAFFRDDIILKGENNYNCPLIRNT